MLRLRSLNPDDAKMLFEWRNDPFIIQLGTQQQAVSWDEHLKWIRKAEENPEARSIFIIENDQNPIGQIRFDRNSENPKSSVISVYLLPAFMGKGLGVQAIQRGIELISHHWKDVVTIHAMVRRDNVIGSRAFLKAGFLFLHEDAIHHVYSIATLNAIPHNKLTFDAAEIEAVRLVIESGYWAGGSVVGNLEQELSTVTGLKRSVTVASGFSALRLSLLALGIKDNDEVIIPAYCCVALPNAILSINAIPVPVDIDPETLTITRLEVGKQINSRTKAIIAVHTFGFQCDTRSLKEFGIPVIEDFAHGFRTNEDLPNKVDIAVFSFYATKFIGAGEGGAVSTSDSGISEFIIENRDYTDKAPSRFRQNDKMTDITAAIVRVQLSKMEFFLSRRTEIAKRYFHGLKELESSGSNFLLPEKSNKTWYRFTVRETKQSGALMKFLADNGIATARPVENWLLGKMEKFKHSAFAADQIVSIPIYPTLTVGQQDHIMDSILKFYKKN